MKRGFHALSDLPQTLPIFPLTGVVLLPHSALPLNVFEPRYLALVDDVLSGNRLIGMIQPVESEDDVLKPKLSEVGCAGRIVSYRETEDNRYLITLAGVCRFRVREEVPVLSPYRQVACDFAPFVPDLVQSETDLFPFRRAMMTSGSLAALSRRLPHDPVRWTTPRKAGLGKYGFSTVRASMDLP